MSFKLYTLSGDALFQSTTTNPIIFRSDNTNGSTERLRVTETSMTLPSSLVFGTNVNKLTLTYASNQQTSYSIPPLAASSSFVFTDSNQTINDTKTFSSIQGTVANTQKLATARSLWGTSFDGSEDVTNGVVNILSLGTQVNKAELYYDHTSPVSVDLTPAQNADFILTDGAQTINGTKTFSSSVVANTSNSTSLLPSRTIWGSAFTGSGNIGNQVNQATSIQLGTQTNKLTLTAAADQSVPFVPGTLVSATLEADVIPNSSFVMSQGNQTINGLKRFLTRAIGRGVPELLTTQVRSTGLTVFEGSPVDVFNISVATVNTTSVSTTSTIIVEFHMLRPYIMSSTFSSGYCSLRVFINGSRANNEGRISFATSGVTGEGVAAGHSFSPMIASVNNITTTSGANVTVRVEAQVFGQFSSFDFSVGSSCDVMQIPE